jgi:urea transporter/Ca2+-binding EF-hand superfamily protein
MPAESPSAFTLLEGLLQPPPAEPSRLQRLLPCSGTLMHLNDTARRDHRPLLPLLIGLRSLAQVIFINNPLTGALLLAAFLLESPWMAVLAVAGTAAANITSRSLGLERSLRHQGIHGFNGALVGCAGAVLGGGGSMPLAAVWLLLVLLGSCLSTLMLEGWRRRFHRRGDLPPLTLPFCLVTWLLLLVTGGLPLAPPDPAATPVTGILPALLLGLPRSFGQVFLCAGLGSGGLVLLATALASPLAAGLGLLGAGVAMAGALLLGVAPAAVAQGLWGYNGVLVAIAVGGIFHAPTRRSLVAAVVAAALVTPVAFVLRAVLPGLPPLTLGFVLTTWILQLAVRRTLPALIPVSLHAVVTPEEHRERYRVARGVLRSFRANLRRRLDGRPPDPITDAATDPESQRIRLLFRRLDRDGDGTLSLAELRGGLPSTGLAEAAEAAHGSAIGTQLERILDAMDLDRDGRVDLQEFTELIVRLQRLRQEEERLLLYLMPADADGDDRLDVAELARLLASIGEPPLTAGEQHLVFGSSAGGLSWRDFVDRLLLT